MIILYLLRFDAVALCVAAPLRASAARDDCLLLLDISR